MNKIRNTIQSLVLSDKNRNATKQLVIGSTTGFATGYVTMTIGKQIVFVAGGGIILFQVGRNYGLTKMDWSEASSKAKSMAQKLDADTNNWKDRAKAYAKNNSSFTASFVGGFLMGAASTA